VADAVTHGRIVLGTIFAYSSRPALDHALRFLTPSHFTDPVQAALFAMAERHMDLNHVVLTRAALEDGLRSAPPGTAAMYGEYYDAVCLAAPPPTRDGHGAFTHSVLQLRELTAERLTGEALTTAKQILVQGRRDGRDELYGHADARSWLTVELSRIERELHAEDAPEGDIRHEQQQVLQAYARRRELAASSHGGAVSTGVPELDAILGTGLEKGELDLVIGFTSAGKAQPLDAGVLTPRGWRCMGDLRPGDEVVDPAGETSRVLGVYPQGVLPVYRLTFSDGSSCEASADHLWEVELWSCRKQPRTQRGVPARQKAVRLRQVLTTDQLRQRLEAGKRGPRLVPVQPPEFPEQVVLPVDPYLLGLLLGDGSFTSGSVKFFSADAELIEAVRASVPARDELTVSAAPGRRLDQYRIVKRARHWPKGTPSATCAALRWLGLYGHPAQDKFVPEIYKLASSQTRLAVLQGLMDTDGGRSRNLAEFGSASRQLRDDVIWLARSLGLTASAGEKDTASGRPCYRAWIRETSETRVFRLSRKLGTVPFRDSRTVRSVEYLRDAECRCIAVSAPSQLYVTDDFIPTHNTSFLVQLAWHAAVVQGANVVFFTTETLRPQVRIKILARHSRLEKFGLREGLNSADIKGGRLTPAGEQAFAAVVSDFAQIPGRCYVAQMPRGATVASLESRLARITREWPADLVIIDSLQLLRSETRRRTQWEEAVTVVKDAKDVARTYRSGTGVPVVSPWQVSKEARKAARDRGFYTKEDLNETHEAATSSDIIVSLLEPDEFTGGRNVLLQCGVPKNRDGEARFGKDASLTLDTDYATSFFAARSGGTSAMSSLMEFTGDDLG
jgi:replicative DNA helicase